MKTKKNLQIKVNQDIQENPAGESESFTKRNPTLNSEPHRLINLQG